MAVLQLRLWLRPDTTLLVRHVRRGVTSDHSMGERETKRTGVHVEVRVKSCEVSYAKV